MKRTHRQVKPRTKNRVTVLTPSFSLVGGIIFSLFILEFTIALGINLPYVLESTAHVLAALAGGIIVFLQVMSRLFQPLHRNPQTVLRMMDSTVCFILTVISVLGLFWETVSQIVLWVNVLILLRWVYDIIASYIDKRRAEMRALAEASCPDKIEHPGGVQNL